ncbi:hypothetical protein JOL79_22270 [Microbispora sp. RL4-1S]|uniref:ABC3 transporter permease C-terminal domain-containing protein n=1 Tax=Microbispora oryzae TaxID=2806554 RepID=A0A940WT40_9ACTN|nr:FtsX-like permease family protein [Microbispora oryzae]MBP2706539.1 hypothetical protein [Microbispora oryzae]
MIRLSAVHRGTAALLAALMLGATLLVSGLPRMIESSLDAAAAETVRTAPPVATSMLLTYTSSPFDPLRAHGVSQAGARDAALRALVPPGLRQIVADTGTYGFATPATGVRRHTYLTLQWLSGIEGRVRFVRGAPPGPASGGRMDVALAAAPAKELSLDVGDVLHAGSITARVSGLFEPVRPADRFWASQSGLTRVVHRLPPLADEEDLYVTGLTDGDGLAAAADTPLVYSWIVDVDAAKVTAGDAAPALAGLDVYGRRLGGQDFDVALSTGLDRVLTEYLNKLGATRALMGVALSALVLVCLGALALGILLLAQHMGPALRLMRARGASLPYIAAVGGGAVALATVPAAIIGAALATLVPGPATLVTVLGPVALALAAAATGCAAAVRAQSGPLQEARDDLVSASPSGRRLVLEGFVLVLGVGGTILLRTRGLAGGDLTLVAVPALLAVALALVVLRLYVLPLRLAVRLASRRRGPLPYLGLIMGARAGAGAVLPALTLLPALAVGTYAGVTQDAIGVAQRVTAWQQVGAPVRLEWDREVTAAEVERVRRLPGVRDVVPAAVGRATAQVGFGGRAATVFAVDLDAYRRLVAGDPVTLPASPGAGGALVSRDLSAMRSFEIDWPEPATVTPKGVVTGMPAVDPADGALIVVPGAPKHPNTLLVDGDEAAVRGIVEAGVRITTVDRALAELAREPLMSAVTGGLRVMAAALAAYALAAVLIALVAGAPRRARVLALLRSLGLTRPQAGATAVVETAPPLLVTAAAGLLLGLGLPWLLGRGVDPAAYAGGSPASDPAAYTGMPVLPLLVAAAVTAIALAGAYLGGSRGHSR